MALPRNKGRERRENLEWLSSFCKNYFRFLLVFSLSFFGSPWIKPLLVELVWGGDPLLRQRLSRCTPSSSQAAPHVCWMHACAIQGYVSATYSRPWPKTRAINTDASIWMMALVSRAIYVRKIGSYPSSHNVGIYWITIIPQATSILLALICQVLPSSLESHESLAT
jgi:hypothetical protein